MYYYHIRCFPFSCTPFKIDGCVVHAKRHPAFTVLLLCRLTVITFNTSALLSNLGLIKYIQG